MPTRATFDPAPFRSVLVATDFSPGAARALERATRLPLAAKSQLIVLHVLPRLPQEMAAGASRAAQTALDGLVRDAAENCRKRGVHVEVRSALATGDPAEEVPLAARYEGVELIVLGRHSHRRVRDVFLGSTAHRVVRAAGLPVLVVSGAASAPYRRPLAAVDLEAMSRATLELLVRVLGPKAKTVGLVHAFEVSFEGIAFPSGDVTKLTRWGQRFRRAAEAQVGEFLRWLPDLGVRWTPSVRPGSASTAILTEAERRRADLLAVGTHGKPTASRLLLGSVAERVLANSRSDVLVARPSPLVRAAPRPVRPAARRKIRG